MSTPYEAVWRDECKCPCHTNARVMHFMPCCTPRTTPPEQAVSDSCEDEGCPHYNKAIKCEPKPGGCIATVPEQPDDSSCVSDDILEAVINEHDMNVPDELLASPGGFGAHRESMRKALEKIIPLTMHIEAEYKKVPTKHPTLSPETLRQVEEALRGFCDDVEADYMVDGDWVDNPPTLISVNYIIARKALAALGPAIDEREMQNGE